MAGVALDRQLALAAAGDRDEAVEDLQREQVGLVGAAEVLGRVGEHAPLLKGGSALRASGGVEAEHLGDLEEVEEVRVEVGAEGAHAVGVDPARPFRQCVWLGEEDQLVGDDDEDLSIE